MKIGIDEHISAAHMVLGKDLNPHDTLFAGQAASYMIECGFLAVQTFLGSPHIVFLALDGMRFLRPVHKGMAIQVDSTIVYAGTSSVGAYIRLSILAEHSTAAECFVSFVHIDELTGRAMPHQTALGELDDQGKQWQKAYLAYHAMS
ncbi:MAG: acyl-CoA thioesterase [Megasphaera sp.]|jgi:acyl-CoA hydrolase|nr:acyl-CoA thioesterase [Megasphaera sp.]MCH4187391.1 acyl-CoA thioesterase [Megasphaera sp.]MCH4217573.1 acyl-CoA thioesterase [Megasphaera sp.]